MTSISDIITIKVLVVGEPGVGKTSLIQRISNGTFSDTYKATIGVDFALVTKTVDKMQFAIQLWDIAGQERAKSATRIYYENAKAAMIVYDITRPETQNAVLGWKMDITSRVDDIPLLLVANKKDLESKTDPLPDFTTASASAKTGAGTEELIDIIIGKVKEVLNLQSEIPRPPPVQLSPALQPAKSTCSC